jgi:hypothetical protein
MVKKLAKRNKVKVIDPGIPPSPPSDVKVLSPVELADTQFLFSFSFLDVKAKLFNPFRLKGRYFLAVLRDLKDLSQINVVRFQKNVNDHKWHNHPIDWADSAFKDKNLSFFPKLGEQYHGCHCWQFKCGNSGCRAHGFFISNVFYIVWLDHGHELFPRQNT